jgi:CubicO group peptidase (beta-lactamase class C family)
LDWAGIGLGKKLLAALPHTSYTSLPGTEYSYSNIGYAILGAALARVAGQSYIEWERSRVFKPLGMGRTRFELDPTIESDLAVGYQVNGDGTLDDQTATQEARDGRGYKVPNGAIFTTVDDLARFVVFELGRGPDSVLDRSMLDEAFGGVVATDALQTGYGLGFMAMRRRLFLGHSGASDIRQHVLRPRMKLGVVLFRMSSAASRTQSPRHRHSLIVGREESRRDPDRHRQAGESAPRLQVAKPLFGDSLENCDLGLNYDLMSP